MPAPTFNAADVADRLGAALAPHPFRVRHRGVAYELQPDEALSAAVLPHLRVSDVVGWARAQLADPELDITADEAYDLLADVTEHVMPDDASLDLDLGVDGVVTVHVAAVASPRHLAELRAGRAAAWAKLVAIDGLPARPPSALARSLALAALAAVEPRV
ncbi:hypothetical protein [Microbacterium aureliae]